jgi:sulfur carrier protein ThiS
MEIQVRVLAGAAHGLPAIGKASVRLPEGANGADLLAAFAIPGDSGVILIVNGRRQPASAVLQAGDSVGLMQPVAGG